MEEIELSYAGIKDGARFKVPVGTQRFEMPNPTLKVHEFDSAGIMPSPHDTLSFIRRPHSNVFVLEQRHHQMQTAGDGGPVCKCGYKAVGVLSHYLMAQKTADHIAREHSRVNG